MDADRWERRLAELAGRYQVPGAALGILRVPDDPSRGDDPVAVSTGVLNTATGVEATPDSLFQIGSMTKSFTATVALRLVEDGAFDLDVPVIEYLPELRLGDAGVAKTVTVRQLLTHTSGIDGDVFTDTGRGDDCLARYVAALENVAQNHPPGATFSYCNSGYVLLGRLIEKITGVVWDRAMRDLLFAPLGLTHTATLPEEALMFRVAVGHHESGGRVVPVGQWGMPRSGTPAGTNVSCDVNDVLRFARMHLADGRSPHGDRILSAPSARLMRMGHVELPNPYTLGDSWGLGWIRFLWDGHRVVGHDGGTIGQSAFLRLCPDRRLAVVLLTNGGHPHDLYHRLFAEIFAEEAGIAMPAAIEPPATPVAVDHRLVLGTYERAGLRTEIFERDGRPVLRATTTGPLTEFDPASPQEHQLVPVRDQVFALRRPGDRTWTPVVFYRLANGDPYVHYDARATPKVT